MKEILWVVHHPTNETSGTDEFERDIRKGRIFLVRSSEDLSFDFNDCIPDERHQVESATLITSIHQIDNVWLNAFSSYCWSEDGEEFWTLTVVTEDNLEDWE